MNDPGNAVEWVNHAEEDLIMAKSALKRRRPLTTGSCFHSQQCAEKYLKAILVAQDVEFPKTHDLLILDALCTSAGGTWNRDNNSPVCKGDFGVEEVRIMK